MESAPIDMAIVERYYQIEAIRSIAKVLENKGRECLVVMATGTVKTRTNAALVDVLSKANWAKRVLFLADRNALIYQAKKAFTNHLPSLPAIDLTKEKDNLTARVVFSTYQTMINQIDEVYDDEHRHFGVGHFDMIIFDEIHRSVYNKYKAIFDYFDGFKIGLTATPKHEGDRDTYQLFGLEPNNPTYSYELELAVKDKFLVPPKLIPAPTKFHRMGIKYDELTPEEQREYEEKLADPVTGEFPDEVDSAALNNWLFNKDTTNKVLANNNDVTLNAFFDSLGIYPETARIIKVECYVGPYLPETTCNPTCPDGIYAPFGLPGVSYYVKSGVSTGKPTSGIPGGYQNERFFSIFNLKKADSTDCQFYNVWVYDNKPLAIDSSGIFSGSCATDARTPLYKFKIRRFPEYQDKNAFIDNALAANPNDLSVSALVSQVNECNSNCEQQADFWIDILSKCTTDQNILNIIKINLIDVCSQAFFNGQINGASSFNYDELYSRTFEDVIRDFLGPNAINDSCTQELLGMPYPFGKDPKYSQKLIDVTDYRVVPKTQ